MGKYKHLKEHDFGYFENPIYADGVLTLPLASWNDFHEVVKIFDKNTDYLWRGQENECPLKASFDRSFDNVGRREARLNEIYKEFEQRLNDGPKSSPLFSENEVWAIRQHYGLLTPLLDWSECPYIAAYFAFYRKESDKHGAIYALNKAVQRLLMKKKQEDQVLLKERAIEFIDDKHLDRIQLDRLEAQKGVFTQAFDGNDIERYAKTLYKKSYKLKEILLAKILVPGQYRNESLRFLKSVKITHGTLFPDYRAAVERCELQLHMSAAMTEFENEQTR